MTRTPAFPGLRGRIAPSLLAVLVLAGGLARVRPVAASDDFEFAVIDSGERTTLSMGDLDHMDGLGRLQDEARTTGKPLFWFSQDGREYVVRDPALVSRAREVVAPMQELGKKQGKLGAKQGKLGARQGQLGALQGRAGMLQARIALLGLSGDAKDRAARDEMRAELREIMRQVDDLADEQRALGDAQRELGAQQAELGRQQSGIRHDVVSGLRKIAEDAIASGAEQRLRG